MFRCSKKESKSKCEVPNQDSQVETSLNIYPLHGGTKGSRTGFIYGGRLGMFLLPHTPLVGKGNGFSEKRALLGPLRAYFAPYQFGVYCTQGSEPCLRNLICKRMA